MVTIMNPFPHNPGTALKVMMIAMELENITHQSVFAESIRANGKTKPAETIRMIYDQMQDNPTLVFDIVGKSIFDKIEKLFV